MRDDGPTRRAQAVSPAARALGSLLALAWLAAAPGVRPAAAQAARATPPTSPPAPAPAQPGQPRTASELEMLPQVEAASMALRSWVEARQLMEAHQPGLRRQRAALIRARADVAQALSRLLPSLEAGVGADYSLVRPAFLSVDRPAEHELFASRSLIPNATAAFAITFSLADLAASDSAQAGVEAERQGLSASRHALLSELASTLLGVLGAERVAARNAAGLHAARERLRLTERLLALGRATELDRARFLQDLNEAASNLIHATESLSQAREALGNALGLAQPVGLSGEFDALELLSPRASGCAPIADLAARAERRAARARQRQAALAARSADLSYLPELRLVSQYVASYAPTSAVTFEGQRGVLHTWSASANLVWAIYDGGARGAASTRAEADAMAARADRDAALIATATEARRARRLVSLAQSAAEIARRDLEAARTVDRLSRRGLELGNASALEAVDAARRLRVTEITLAVREVELLAARVRAQMAMAVCR